MDVRLPTGRREDLLGAGSASVKFSGIGSVETGHVTLHVNGGVSLGGLARELSAGGAVTVAATSRLTIVGELVGRRLDGVGGIVQVAASNPGIPGVETFRLAADTSSLTLVTFAPGLKWNLTDTWVLAANVSVPLTNAGLHLAVHAVHWLDYAFGRYEGQRSTRAVSIFQSVPSLRSVKFQVRASVRGSRLPTFGT